MSQKYDGKERMTARQEGGAEVYPFIHKVTI